MKKKYLYVVLLLLSNLLAVGQTVTLTPTTVNGASVSTGPINLGSVNSSTILLSAKVALKTAPSDSKPGTITIYSQKSASSSPIAPTGGKGGELLFLGTTSAERTFTISLEFSNFDPSGGVIYAEYKTYSGTIYKSDPISVIRQASSTGGGIPANAPNPANIANTICCNQTVRLGDKPDPIVGSQYANPYENYSYGISSSYSINSSLPFEIDKINKTLNFDYTTALKNITITRGLGYSSTVNHTNKSNTVTITVVPSPILLNEISVNASVDPNGFFEISNTNPKTITGITKTRQQQGEVNLNILQDPSHISQSGDTFTAIERFEWEYIKTDERGFIYNGSWTTIENENSAILNYFSPENIPNTGDNFFLLRRIAIYKNIRRASNLLKIILRKVSDNNIICCDQILAEDTTLKQIEKTSIITGSTPSIDKLSPDITDFQLASITYQWQSQSITNGRPNIYGTWSNIQGATSKDYLPLPLQYIIVTTRYGESLQVQTTYNYRRITTINYYYTINNTGSYKLGNKVSYSNEINIKSEILYASPTLIVYPNPATSIIYVENKRTDYILATSKINIVNIMGTLVNSNNFSIINPNLISIDVSNLIIGTYFINIQTDRPRIGRNNQIGFIKTN
ncbi:T9SS type A sorting domain-containing protein [Flavobacterium aestuarii]|uniref:T9SS type A sorting domain-containing protein n=1 Tax=Flavobacterium aestuarii TaxID=3149227 RepID=UPI0032B3607D